MNIKGLTIIRDFIDEQTEKDLITFIDKQKWNESISRRTQHFGYEYNYGKKGLTNNAMELPTDGILSDVITRIEKECYDTNIQQAIINEYIGLQNINAHIDHTRLFGPIVTTLSLGSEAVMRFSKDEYKTIIKEGKEIDIIEEKEVNVRLYPRSLIVLKEDARYVWKHEIPKVKVFMVDGEKIPRGDNFRRISITTRTLL